MDIGDSVKSDDELLKRMGLKGLKGEAKDKALNDILYVLNMRVGQRIVETLNEQQLAEFEKFDENTPTEEVSTWMQQNVPKHLQIIEEEARALRDKSQATTRRVMGRLKSKNLI